MIDTLIVNDDVEINIVRNDAQKIITALSPLGDDVVGDMETSMAALRHLSLADLSVESFNHAYELFITVTSIDPVYKNVIKQALEADGRFKKKERV